MKIAVENNSLYCPDINSRIHHMECNDECKHFCGCAIADQSFIIKCSWTNTAGVLQQPVVSAQHARHQEGVFSA